MNPTDRQRGPRAAQTVILLALVALVALGVVMWSNVTGEWRMRDEHDVRRTNAEHDVVVFVAEWCGYCKRLQAWLDASGVPHRVLDVEKSEAASYGQEAVVGRYAGVPTTVIGTDVYQGLRTDELRARLTQAGYTMRGDP